MADATRSLKIVVEEERKGDGYREAGRDISTYADKVAAADLRTKQWTENSKNLQAEISRSKTRIQELRQEVAKTGDTSIFGDIRKEEARLRGFEQTLKALAPQVGQNLSKGIGDAFSGVMPKLMPLVIGTVAALAPMLGAVVAGAVVGVAGIGGVAGGIFAASKDPQVRAAASDLGKHISTSFFASGDSFVDPIKQSVVILKKDFDELNLGKTFQLASPFVTEFAQGIGGIATEFMPRFNQVLKDGKPAIDLFAQELPQIGTALGDFGVKLADSKGAIDGVNALFALTTGTIEGTGSALAWLGNRYHDFNVTMVDLSGWLEKFDRLIGDNQGAAAAKEDAEAFGRVSKGAEQGAIAFNTLGGQVAYTGAVMEKYGRTTDQVEAAQKALNDEVMAGEKAIDGYINAAIAASNASIAVAQDFADMGKELIRGKKNWDENTQAGRDNLSLINKTIGDLERQRQQAIDTSDGSTAAIDRINKKYNDQMKALEALAVKAGDTKAAFEAMAGVYQITILEDIRMAGVNNKLSSLDKSLRFAGGRASGGPVTAGYTYKVNENTPNSEYFTPSTSGYITPPSSGGGMATGAPSILVSASSGAEGAFTAWLMKYLRFEVRTNGGGSADRAFS